MTEFRHALTAVGYDCEAHMKKSTTLLVLLLILLSSLFSQVFATSPYRPGGTRKIDANYELNAIGDGRITLTHKTPPRAMIFKVQGSGNSEYCIWSRYVLIRVVPLQKDDCEDENECEDDNKTEAKPQFERLGRSPEEIDLPGQPYEYYIFVRKTAEIIGPLTEDEFVQRNEVGKYKIKWKYIETTKQEYKNGFYLLGLIVLIVVFCVFVLPWFVLLIIIKYVARWIIKKRRARQQAKCATQSQESNGEGST